MSPLFRNAPARWRTVRLKDTVTACRNGLWGDDPDGSTENLICVRVADFDRLKLRVSLENPTLRRIPRSQRHGRILSDGDLLLEKSGGGDAQPVGIVVLYQQHAQAVCSNFIARMPVATGYDPRYLCYLHAALYTLGVTRRFMNQTTGIQNLDSAAYLAESVKVPELNQQRRLTRWLDGKLELLDSLICARGRQADLLFEMRDALVSRTIVRGLEPSVSMRQTGISSMPEIPSRWQMTRLKYVRSGCLLYGSSEPASTENQGMRLIRITDIDDDGTLREASPQSLEPDLARPYRLRDGDLLLARSGATVGKAIRYRADWGPACFASYLIRVRPDQRKIHPDFLRYYTQSRAFRQEVRLAAVQATIANVSAERYANFPVPLPPLEEQCRIVEFLDGTMAALQTAAGAMRRQIDVFREYRRALIVTAVTRGCCGVADPLSEGVCAG
ncbi:MAG: hypothetical protein DMG57_02095 [Acidobacteria bacterium]|nr:MAG: hypothetical protein DMG57_02095 [Acidobacteriota bacterium]